MALPLHVRDHGQRQAALAAFAGFPVGRLNRLLNYAGIARCGGNALIVDINVQGVFNGGHTALDLTRRAPAVPLINVGSDTPRSPT